MAEPLTALLEEVEEGLMRSLRYSRLASYLATVEVVLLAVAVAAVAAYFVLYVYMLTVAAFALVAVAYVIDKLSNRYYKMALDEMEKVDKIARIIALATAKEKALEVLTKLRN
jgi:hypothetical protein